MFEIASRTKRTRNPKTPDNEVVSTPSLIMTGFAFAYAFQLGVVLDVPGLEHGSSIASAAALFAGVIVSLLSSKRFERPGSPMSNPMRWNLALTLVGILVLLSASYIGDSYNLLLCTSMLVLGYCDGRLSHDLVAVESSLPFEQRVSLIEKAFLVAVALLAVIAFLPDSVQMLGMSALPFLSLLSTWAAGRRIEQPRSTPREKPDTSLHLDKKLLLMGFVINATCTYCLFTSNLDAADYGIFLALAVAAVVVAGVLVVVNRIAFIKSTATLAIGFALSMAAAVLSLQGNVTCDPLVAVISFVAIIFMMVSTIVQALHIAGILGLDVPRYLEATRLWHQAGIVFGTICAFAGMWIGEAQLAILGMLTGMLLTIAAILIASLDTIVNTGYLREDSKEVVYMDGSIPNRSFESRCASLAEEFKLTPREAEVMVHLAKGLSVPSIAEKLTVSESTVKSHSASIFKKFGIHSKQELIALVSKS